MGGIGITAFFLWMVFWGGKKAILTTRNRHFRATKTPSWLCLSHQLLIQHGVDGRWMYRDDLPYLQLSVSELKSSCLIFHLPVSSAVCALLLYRAMKGYSCNGRAQESLVASLVCFPSPLAFSYHCQRYEISDSGCLLSTTLEEYIQPFLTRRWPLTH